MWKAERKTVPCLAEERKLQLFVGRRVLTMTESVPSAEPLVVQAWRYQAQCKLVNTETKETREMKKTSKQKTTEGQKRDREKENTLK